MKPTQDMEYLRLLSIFHYVVAAILAVISMFPLIHVVVGILIIAGVFKESETGGAPPEMFGWMLAIFPALMILVGLTISACVAMAGYRLRRAVGYTFCLVVAAIECMLMPFGTVLGVFTIIVLMRPGVKESFELTKPIESPPDVDMLADRIRALVAREFSTVPSELLEKALQKAADGEPLRDDD